MYQIYVRYTNSLRRYHFPSERPINSLLTQAFFVVVAVIESSCKLQRYRSRSRKKKLINKRENEGKYS